ncbi:histidine phosphatase family protein [Amycolatopsis aidingensis]|uniref:histidine phosphatase family protein n=1 Tax=Amycolatopsis aidingensis TaxID=2842453 RepID=UPI001C0A9B42|nr:histidine phosphatase family protein [Amycolatopsis aidingensis]
MRNALYLLRHGETEWSATGRHTGRTDIPLTAAGERQARGAGETLGRLRDPDAPEPVVLASPRSRAMRTAELAGLHPGEVTEELAEWDYGEYEGRTTAEIRRTVPGWTVWSHPSRGGETSAQVTQRARTLITRIGDLLEDTEVILVGHGHFSRVLVACWLGMSASDGVRFALGPAGISVLGAERGTPQIRHLNVPACQRG